MATGQTLLNMMEVFHPELQNQPGEESVARSLLALNMAQDFLESLLAQLPGVLGSAAGVVQTAPGVETTAFPAGVLRIDKLQRLDPVNQRPVGDLEPILEAGGHLPGAPWPLGLVAGAEGAPAAYWTNGTLIYWSPVPDAIYPVRWYGFQTQADLTAAGTFGYPDVCLAPVAAMAARILRVGLDDPESDLKAIAGDLFEPVLMTLGRFRRERARGFNYRYVHNT